MEYHRIPKKSSSYSNEFIEKCDIYEHIQKFQKTFQPSRIFVVFEFLNAFQVPTRFTFFFLELMKVLLIPDHSGKSHIFLSFLRCSSSVRVLLSLKICEYYFTKL